MRTAILKKSRIFEIVVILSLLQLTQLHAGDVKYGFALGLIDANCKLTDTPRTLGDITIYFPMVSFNVNGFLQYKGYGQVGFSAEPGFIVKGAVQKTNTDNIRFDYNYLQLPLRVDLYMTDYLYLSAGPEFSYLMSAKAHYQGTTTTIPYDDLKKFELSGFIGLNFRIKNQVDLGIGFNRGFTYTNKIFWSNSLRSLLGTSKQYNQYIQLIVRRVF